MSLPRPPVYSQCAKPMRFAGAELDTNNSNVRRMIYACDDCGRTSIIGDIA